MAFHLKPPLDERRLNNSQFPGIFPAAREYVYTRFGVQYDPGE